MVPLAPSTGPTESQQTKDESLGFLPSDKASLIPIKIPVLYDYRRRSCFIILWM